MSAHHREFDKNFQTEIKLNGKKLPLNHFVQETVANMIVGLLKTLKEVDEPEKTIEIMRALSGYKVRASYFRLATKPKTVKAKPMIAAMPPPTAINWS